MYKAVPPEGGTAYMIGYGYCLKLSLLSPPP